MRISINKPDPSYKPIMKIQWLLMALFLSAWIILALVFFVPNL